MVDPHLQGDQTPPEGAADAGSRLPKSEALSTSNLLTDPGEPATDQQPMVAHPKDMEVTPGTAPRRKLIVLLTAVGALIAVLGIALGVGLGVGLGRRHRHGSVDDGSDSGTPAPDGGSNPSTKLPASPADATFTRFEACPGATQATVPLFYSPLWVDPDAASPAPSNATTAVVVQHGIGRNFQVAFAALAPVLDLRSTVLVAPNFYYPSDRPHKFKNGTYSNWYNASQTLTWATFDSWVGGGDPSGPSRSQASTHARVGEGKSCSTYDLYDRFFSIFTNTTLYPRLERLIFAGHSGGGAFLSRYAMFSPDPPAGGNNVSLRFVQANSPNFAYFTPERPNATHTQHCRGWNEWEYGLAGKTNRYVKDKLKTPIQDLFRRYISLDIISMQGNMDTRRWFPVGDYGCQVEAQGGDDRRDRNYAWWVYKNLLAGQPTNVSQFPFYHEVRALIPERMSLQNATLPVRARAQNNGNDPVATQAEYTYTASTVQADARRAQARNPTRAPLFRHRFCVVPDVGHKAPLMWNSTCGHEAFTVPGIAANPSFASYPPLQPQEYRGPGSAQHGSTSSDYD